jgi:hypothetical protein
VLCENVLESAHTVMTAQKIPKDPDCQVSWNFQVDLINSHDLKLPKVMSVPVIRVRITDDNIFSWLVYPQASLQAGFEKK